MDPNDDFGTDAPMETSPKGNRRNRVILLAVAAIAMIAGLAWFARYQLVGQYIKGTNNAYIQADSITVSPKISGYVDRVLVAENQFVKAGQPLLQIDPRDYRAQSAQYQAQIDLATANADGARAQILEQQAMIDSMRADLDAAASDAAFAKAEVARYAPLVETGAESKERLSQLRHQARQASARTAGARAALAGAERRIDTLRAQVAQAQAQGAAARAQLAAANVNVGSTLIRASIDGRVGNQTVREGQFVQSGMRLMSIVPVGRLYVQANFKETQLGLMRIGQPATVTVDALPGIELHGRVESLSPGTGAQFSLLPPQNATGNFTKIVQRVPVRIAIATGPETRKLLLPGMSVEVEIDTRSARGDRDKIEQEQEALDRKRP